MLSARDRFKLGFLRRCVEEGLDRDQIAARVKQADGLGDIYGEAKGLGGHMINLGTGLAKGVLEYGMPLAIAAPPVLGGLAGYGLARATDIDDTDVADIRDQELIEEYRRQAEQLQRQNIVRDYQKARGAARPRFHG